MGDWHLTEESQRSALAELVSAITDLDTSARWGQGKTAASDGQRFSLPRRVLQQTYSTRFSDFALEFYTFVADNYAPFYSLPIECTDRDAAFVLDGLLYNESELEIEERYTLNLKIGAKTDGSDKFGPTTTTHPQPPIQRRVGKPSRLTFRGTAS